MLREKSSYFWVSVQAVVLKISPSPFHTRAEDKKGDQSGADLGPALNLGLVWVFRVTARPVAPSSLEPASQPASGRPSSCLPCLPHSPRPSRPWAQRASRAVLISQILQEPGWRMQLPGVTDATEQPHRSPPAVSAPRRCVAGPHATTHPLSSWPLQAQPSGPRLFVSSSWGC